jgi:predicted transposase/invertase (TIGR01784 family)
MSRKLVSFDWALKHILCSKVHFEILEGFLSELLLDNIKILDIFKSKNDPSQYSETVNHLNIKVENTNQEIILIEMQYSSELDYLQRILYHTSKVVLKKFKQGDAYSNIAKIVSINILYFDFGDGNDYLYKGSTEFIGMNNNTPLKLNTTQTNLYYSKHIDQLYSEYYLIKVKNFDDHIKNNLDEWIYFLKNQEIKDQFNAKGLKKAKETLDYLKMSNENCLQYQYHQENLHYRARFYESTFTIGKIRKLKKGREQRLAEGTLITAKHMKSADTTLKTIHQVTGLSLQQIKAL